MTALHFCYILLIRIKSLGLTHTKEHGFTWRYSIFFCSLANNNKKVVAKSNTNLSSHSFIGQNSDILCFPLRVSEGLNQGVFWVKLLPVGYMEESTFKLIRVVGQIHLLVIKVLRFPFTFWLSGGSFLSSLLTITHFSS